MPFDLLPALKRLDELADTFVRSLPGVLTALLVFLLFYAVAKAVRMLARRAAERRGHVHAAGLVIGRLAQGGIVLIGTLVALSVALPTFRPGDIVELLGIGSIAIGFAFRDILQNFLAGILLLITRPFYIGDQIVVSNNEGTVEDIQTRATFIRTYDGRRIVIPNAELFTQKVTVNTAFEQRRLEYDIGIGYSDNIDQAKRIILQTMRETEGVLKTPEPDVLVMDLAPSSLNIRARWWITPPRHADALDARDKVLAAIRIKLKENGIDLPFPTQQVLFHDQTEETDGDRSRQREGWPAGKDPAPRPRSVAGAIAQYARVCGQEDGDDARRSPGQA
ncbi:MAG: mechanosensitive ion channel family protein [Nitrospirota bacterium]